MSLPDSLIEKQAPLRRALLAWFRRTARDLPWRRTRDPYAVWVAEIMLQQTRVDQGTPYYERFLAAFPTVQALAAATEDQVLKRWEGLGYYARARNLHKAAKQVVADRGGDLPRTAADWETLPGVGRYTARAIASIAFGERVAVLDGNVKRVLARLFNIADCIDDTATIRRLWAIADGLVSPRSPGNFNQAMMELGARVCTPKRPWCAACPVRAQCDALAAGAQEDLPVRRPKKTPPHREHVVAAIRRNGRYLIAKRPPNGLLGGLWEFPGGEIQPGETRQAALARVVKTALGIDIRVGGLVASVSHAYSHFTVALDVYRCDPLAGRPQANAHVQLKWVRPAQFDRYAFPKANHKFLGLL